MDIFYVASIITAVTTIATFLFKMYQCTRKFVEGISSSKDDLAKLAEEVESIRMYLLKIVIMDEALGIEERIHAGDEYVSRGGNGYVKATYNKLVKEVEQDER